MFLFFPPRSVSLGYFCILPVYFEGTVFGASSSRLIYILLAIKIIIIIISNATYCSSCAENCATFCLH